MFDVLTYIILFSRQANKFNRSNVWVSPEALCCALEHVTLFSAFYRFNPGKQEHVPTWLKIVDWDIKHRYNPIKLRRAWRVLLKHSTQLIRSVSNQWLLHLKSSTLPYRQTNRRDSQPGNRRTDRQTDRQLDSQTIDRQTDMQTDRNIHFLHTG